MRTELSVPARRILLAILIVAVTAILAMGFLPFAWWTSFVAAAFRVRMILGHWPTNKDPSPKHFAASAGLIPAGFENVMPLVVLAVLVSGSLVTMAYRIPKRWWLWVATLVFLLGWASAFGLAHADPGGFVDWGYD
jgi:hypothetical protein